MLKLINYYLKQILVWLKIKLGKPLPCWNLLKCFEIWEVCDFSWRINLLGRAIVVQGRAVIVRWRQLVMKTARLWHGEQIAICWARRTAGDMKENLFCWWRLEVSWRRPTIAARNDELTSAVGDCLREETTLVVVRYVIRKGNSPSCSRRPPDN